MVEQDVARMLKKTNHAVVVEDFESILKLNDLAYKYTDPGSDASANILCVPRRVGNTMLFPLTLGAIKWIQDKAMVWFGNNPLFCNLAIGYALENARQPEALWDVSDRKTCIKTITKFWCRCGFSLKELEVALVDLLDVGDDSDGSDNSELNYGPIIALLCSEYGQSPSHWLWDVPHDLVTSLLNEKERNIRADWESARAANKGGKPPPMPDVVKSRFKDYKDFRDSIMEKWDGSRRKN